MQKQRTNITYKVWLEIEQYDEATEAGVTLDAPGASLAQFGTYEEAYAFAESVQNTFSWGRFVPHRTQSGTVGTS